MKKCEDIKLLIHDCDYSRIEHALEKTTSLDTLSKNETTIKRHIRHCLPCQEYFLQHTQLRNQLKAMPRPIASSALQQRILSARMATGQPATASASRSIENDTAPLMTHRKTSKTQSKFYFGIAASVSLLVFALVLSSQQDPQATRPSAVASLIENAIPTQSSISAQVNKPRQVNFLVDSAQLIEDVTFTLSVPPQMALYGYNGKQTLSWRGRLKQGKNLLSVPVMALREQSGILTMKISHEGSIREYKVAVNVQQNRVMLPIRTSGRMS